MMLIDASIQIGQKKCLVVLGCQLSKLPTGRSPTLQDFEPFALKVTDNLNAKFVTQTLLEVSKSVRGIKSICCDRGSDILCGIKGFQEKSPNTKLINDTAHRMANFLEARLKKCDRWKAFREATTLARRKMQNSKIAGCLPPSPRAKARFMNVGKLIQWAEKTLFLLDHKEKIDEIDSEEVNKYLNWLPEYRDEIYHWNKLVLIAETARHVVREEHIHVNIADSFLNHLEKISISSRELAFVDRVTDFLFEQSRDLKPGERLLGTTEPLESMFGKLKAMEKEQTCFGFTSLVMAVFACVGSLDASLVRDAIETVKLKQIDKWTEKEIGESIQSQRRKINSIIKQTKEKVGQKVVGFTERKIVGF